MGVSIMGSISSSTYDGSEFDCGYNKGVEDTKRKINILPNPNPTNYNIVKYQKEGRYLILHVDYPDCTNYEGRKILVYVNTTIEAIVAQARQHGLDPHFAANEDLLSPVARFVPTEWGWNAALVFARVIS